MPAAAVNVPVPVYGEVPPLAVILTVVLPPKLSILPAVAFELNCVGSVMLILVVVVQPLASVIVYECVPALTVNVPVPVYGEVPPLALTFTVVVPPLHKIVPLLEVALNCVGSEIVTVTVTCVLLASLTKYVCVPAAAVNVPIPLYGATPPLAVIVTVVMPP